MWYVYVLYAGCMSVSASFVVRGCAVSRRYINVCNCDMFSIVNVYFDHLKFCDVCIDGRRYVCCTECNFVSNECNVPALCISSRTEVKLCTLCVFALGMIGFLNRDDICMCVVNKQLELLEFVFVSVYVDLQYDEFSLTSTAGSVSLYCVCGLVIVFGLSVRLSWYPMWMRWSL